MADKKESPNKPDKKNTVENVEELGMEVWDKALPPAKSP